MRRGFLTLCVSALIGSGAIAQHAADVAGALEKGEWHTYSGTFAADRHSPLTQISTGNVASLRPVWMYQPPGTGPLEGTPIVANGVMYVTSGPASVVALSVKSGRPLWQWARPISAGVLNLGFPRVNRGVAILGDTVYVGTLDGSLCARTRCRSWRKGGNTSPSRPDARSSCSRCPDTRTSCLTSGCVLEFP